MTFVDHGPVRGIVTSVQELSPTFRRITFSGPELNALAAQGPFYDQRIKIILPNVSDQLPEIPQGPQWYQAWLALPDDQRGMMRTYSIRDMTRVEHVTSLSIDFVLHCAEDGSTGPASAWAAAATPGDELLLVAPRVGAEAVGIEFCPGGAEQIVLLGDEAAAPAIGRILEDLDAVGHTAEVSAYIEVPTAADQLAIDTAAQVNWLPRDDAPLGQPLVEALGWHVQDDPVEPSSADELLWETPVFSASGEALATTAAPDTGMYYWIAGESGVIKRLRRFLVNEIGVDRSQVAFMGYWRHGVAMRG